MVSQCTTCTSLGVYVCIFTCCVVLSSSWNLTPAQMTLNQNTSRLKCECPHSLHQVITDILLWSQLFVVHTITDRYMYKTVIIVLTTIWMYAIAIIELNSYSLIELHMSALWQVLWFRRILNTGCRQYEYWNGRDTIQSHSQTEATNTWCVVISLTETIIFDALAHF